MERHWHQRGGRRYECDLDHRGCLAYWRATLVNLGGALNVEVCREQPVQDSENPKDSRGCLAKSYAPPGQTVSRWSKDKCVMFVNYVGRHKKALQ